MEETPSINCEIAALEQALNHLKRASQALDKRNKANHQRLGVYAGDDLARGSLNLTSLRIENELRRLQGLCASVRFGTPPETSS
jgi:hypothetical protein